jgi:hypothetical protein
MTTRWDAAQAPLGQVLTPGALSGRVWGQMAVRPPSAAKTAPVT